MKNKKILIAIITVLTLFLIYIFSFPLKASPKIDGYVKEFDKNGFINANELDDENKLVSKNERFELYLNETNSHFYVLDKNTGEIWRSNPEFDKNDINENQSNTLYFRYFTTDGNLSNQTGNYKRSISHDENDTIPAGYKTFDIKYLDDGFQVLYRIENLEIDYLYFPKYLTPEVVEPIKNDLHLWNTLTLAYHDTLNDKGLYEIRSYEKMSKLVMKELYKIFYEEKVFGEYTRERAIEENIHWGYEVIDDKLEFEIAIEVLLETEGIKISLLKDSIKEKESMKISDISLYPYFGTANSHNEDGTETSGYIVLPEGSGAVLEFNNGKTNEVSYRKRIYDNDLALMPMKMPEESEKVLFPLYGMVKENSGYAAIITEGDAMAILNADTSGFNSEPYNKVYPTFLLREVEVVPIGSATNSKNINVSTKNIVDTDFTIEYTFLEEENNSYVGVANVYRDYLINTFGLEVKDNTKETNVTVEFIGAFDRKKFFMGVPYNSIDSVTTFEEANEIVDILLEEGISNIDVIYKGAINGGLDQGLPNKVKIERILGGKKNFKRLETKLEENNIDLYIDVDFSTTNKFKKPFDKNRYSSRRVQGLLSKDFNYHLPTGLPYEETNYNFRDDRFVISPIYYESIMSQMNKSYRFANIKVNNIGSKLASDFSKNNVIYKQDALNIQKRLLENVDQKLKLSEPLGFAWPYADSIIDLPVETTQYGILDYSIPLVQIVLSGLVDYSTRSLNMPSSRTNEYLFLKALETGSNIKYTLSYEDTEKLLETNYNNYMSTHYLNWIEKIADQTKVMDELQIHKGHIIDHKKIGFNIYETLYSHGLKIQVDYNKFEYKVIEKGGK